MGNWRIWPVDRCVNRLGGTQVTASSNAGLAAYVADSRQVTKWVSGTAVAGTSVSFDFGQQHTIRALALGNCSNIAGEQIRIYYDGSSIGDKSGGVQDNFTYPSNGEPDVLFTFTADNKRYPLFDFTGTISTTLSIGTVSFLDSGAMIEFTSAEGVAFPIAQPIEPGFSEIPLVGGDTIRQTNGGPIRRWILNLTQMAAAASGTYDTIRTSLNTNNGWINGVWLTTDEHDNSTNLRAYYCRPSSTSPIQMAVTTPGAYGDAIIELVEFQRGPV